MRRPSTEEGLSHASPWSISGVCMQLGAANVATVAQERTGLQWFPCATRTHQSAHDVEQASDGAQWELFSPVIKNCFSPFFPHYTGERDIFLNFRYFFYTLRMNLQNHISLSAIATESEYWMVRNHRSQTHKACTLFQMIGNVMLTEMTKQL